MIRRIAVVVPAADEEENIGACLDALVAAAARVQVAVRLIVVLDACTDGTAEIVARYPQVEVVVADERNVGRARRRGAQHAVSSDRDPAELLIASTDADSVVPMQWLQLLLTTSADADLVLGAVVPNGGLSPAVAHAWTANHMLVDGHPHVHAANLAIRAEMYSTIGGWRGLRTGEDHDLHDRVVAVGGQVRRIAEAPVRTSTRAVGRAPRGFSSYLRALGHR